MKIGNFATRKKVTARLFFQRIGFPFLDLGNQTLAKQEPKIDRAQQLSYAKGECLVTHEEPGKTDLRYAITGDERLMPTLELLTLAREVLTKALVDQTIAYDPVPAQGDVQNVGRPYITNVRYTGDNGDAGAAPVEGVDYTVNSVAGSITFLTSYFTDHNVANAEFTFDVYSQVFATDVEVNIGGGDLRTEVKYWLGAYDVSNLVLHDNESDVDLVLGTDYTVDLPSGMITLIGYGNAVEWDVEAQNDGDYADGTVVYVLVGCAKVFYKCQGDPEGNPGTAGSSWVPVPANLTATFNQAAIEIKSYTLLSEAFVRGNVMLILQDMASEGTPAPREVVTFPGELSVTDWGDNDGTKFNAFQLSLAATAAPTVLSRES